MGRFKHLNLEYPIGKIIAQATITDCVNVDDAFAQKYYKKDPLVYKSLKSVETREPYGFKLENVEEIDPIEINGKLSLWDYDYEK